MSLRGAKWSIAAGVVAVVAGFYMLTAASAAADPVVVLARGLGGLGIAAGIWLCVATARRSDVIDLLERIAYDVADDDGEEGDEPITA